MKQKQVKGSAKVAPKQTKATKKAPPPKKVEVVEDATDEEEEVPVKKVVVAKKPTNKKATKVVEVEEVPEEEDEEEVDDEEMEQDVEEVEYDEMDEDEDEVEDEENEEDEEIEADEDNEDDEAGEEEPTIPSKVKSGEIPSVVPASKIVHVTKLPKKFKKIDIIEVFGKYGAIDQIHIVTTPGGSVANVAFKTEKAATAALGANKKVKVLDSLILVTKYTRNTEKKPKTKIHESRERSVYVRYLKAGTTEEELRAHFEGCGELERVKLVNKFNTTFGFVTFTDKSSQEAALKLHNSLLNDVNIGVCENNENPTQVGQLYDEKLTVMMKNIQNFESVEVSKMESIFSKCGEIKAMDIVCKKNVLAFITFKTEQAAQKALKLNGKTEQGIEVELELYNPFNKKTAIYVSNLPKECTEEDLATCFSRAGEISNVFHKGAYAIIRFVDSDAYCKSFLFNESFIKKQMIFVEPLSIRKKAVMRAVMKSKQPKNFQRKGFKRSAQNGNSVFKSKKAKAN